MIFLRGAQARPAEFFTALIDSSGDIVVQYWYDAWGNHKVVDANGNEITSSTHLGNLNPFRYRGYAYLNRYLQTHTLIKY